MNKLLITDQPKPEHPDPSTFQIDLAQASDYLGMLRNDHFLHCEINLTRQLNNSQLRFLMHIGRIMNEQGVTLVKGNQGTVGKVGAVLRNLGLWVQGQGEDKGEVTVLKREPKEEKKVQGEKNGKKLAIGFKSLGDEEVDEDELMKNENINLNKESTGGCGEKPRACANCNCGRKNNEPLPSKEELVKSVNEGKPVSGCGKCYLGDSFRCATCPYQGLPAFKPGDKLKLVDDTKVIIEGSTATVTNGKVKIEL